MWLLSHSSDSCRFKAAAVVENERMTEMKIYAPTSREEGNVTVMTTQRYIVRSLCTPFNVSLFASTNSKTGRIPEQLWHSSYLSIEIRVMAGELSSEQMEHFQPDPLEQSLRPRETLPHTFIYCLLHEENAFMGDLCFLL